MLTGYSGRDGSTRTVLNSAYIMGTGLNPPDTHDALMKLHDEMKVRVGEEMRRLGVVVD